MLKSITSRVPPVFKGRLAAVAGVAVVAIVGITYLNAPGKTGPVSQIKSVPSSLDSVQGAAVVTPAMNAEIAKADQARIDEAKKTGGSAVPTIRLEAMADGDLSVIEPEALAEIDVPKPIIQPVVNRPVPPPPAVQPFVPRPVETDKAREAAVERFRGGMEALKVPTYKAAQVYNFGGGSENREVAAAPSTNRAALAYAAAVPAAAVGPAAGAIVYAQMISTANSDAPGPVVAQIVQGEYAGAKVIGQFVTGRDKLMVQFTSMTLDRDHFGERRSETIPVNAVAVDATNVGSGIATSVDRHLLANVGFAFAGAFAEGFADAVQDSGNNVAISDSGLFIGGSDLSMEDQLLAASGRAVGAAGRNLNTLFGNRPPTIQIASGTPVGVLFLP